MTACSATRADGQPCGALAKATTGLCGAHDPESIALRTDLNRYPARRATVLDRRATLVARRARIDAEIAAIDQRLGL